MKVLYRINDSNKEEFKICSKFFTTETSRCLMGGCSLVIGRYSVLPFYHEVACDIGWLGSYLINTCKQHHYIANFDYYEDIKDYTPKTWYTLEDIPEKYRNKALVLKGKTNSKKMDWNTKMFSDNWTKTVHLYLELLKDDFIMNQGVIVREFVPLKTYQYGINGLPFANEWRFFFYKNNLLCHGYYWVISDFSGELTETGITFAKKIAKIISKKVNFFVLDIAQKENGEWMLIEVNDGQMSGLAACSAETLYENLSQIQIT